MWIPIQLGGKTFLGSLQRAWNTVADGAHVWKFYIMNRDKICKMYQKYRRDFQVDTTYLLIKDCCDIIFKLKKLLTVLTLAPILFI